MDQSTRDFYAKELFWSALKMDWEEFEQYSRSVSSPMTPDGLFSSFSELIEYYNKPLTS
jgi:hypothetical protein